ncbi:MAG: hypothetical protein ACK4M2_12895 [Brevundimonas sp.]
MVITIVRVAPSWSLRDLFSPRAFARREVTPSLFFRHSGRSEAETRNPAARESANLSRTRSSNIVRRTHFAFGAAGFRVYGPNGPSPGMTKENVVSPPNDAAPTPAFATPYPSPAPINLAPVKTLLGWLPLKPPEVEGMRRRRIALFRLLHRFPPAPFNFSAAISDYSDYSDPVFRV